MKIYIVQQLETSDFCSICSGNEIVGATSDKETAEEMKQQTFCVFVKNSI